MKLFVHKCALDRISLSLGHAKWTKSKPTFIQTLNEVWWHFMKVFYNKNFWVLLNFVPFQLIMLCTNNAVTYRIGIKNKHHKNGPRQLIFCDISVLDRSNFTMLKIPS
jgi:hypothetical protein